MKKGVALIAILVVLIAEIVALSVYASVNTDFTQDAVEINSVVKSVERDFDNLNNHVNETSLDYVVIGADNSVLYRTNKGLSEDLNAAIRHRDTIIDIVTDGEIKGKVVIFNTAEEIFLRQRKTAIIVLSALLGVQTLLCALYTLYLYISIIKPFYKLKGFAERVAEGNLDIPLAMDRGNVFGAFSESFDIMRSELKKARIAEAEAQKSKKELVAKLSHDIKTPVASIKAASEVGQALASDRKIKDNYTEIIRKTDQITALVGNLFTATLEELQKLTVSPTFICSRELSELINNADYLHKANKFDIPECLIFADRECLQQVFDNIFANSYKYANTEIAVDIFLEDGYLAVETEDNGGGVDEEELPLLKEKFKRGSNAKNIDGAGLGLYISEYFMREMGGRLTVENGKNGLKVVVFISLEGGKSAD